MLHPPSLSCCTFGPQVDAASIFETTSSLSKYSHDQCSADFCRAGELATRSARIATHQHNPRPRGGEQSKLVTS
eukprot:4402044-Prymnesium_polylepis.1